MVWIGSSWGRGGGVSGLAQVEYPRGVGGGRPSKFQASSEQYLPPPTCLRSCQSPTLTSIRLGLAFSDKGRLSVSTPFLNSALIFSTSISSTTSNWRKKPGNSYSR